MLGNLIDFVAPAWKLARRAPGWLYVALGVAGVVGLHLHNDGTRQETARTEGKAFARDSMLKAAVRLVDSTAGVRAEQSKVVTSTRQATDAGFRHLSDIALAANAATHALEDSLRALSATAQADTTVRAVERASASLVVTVGQLQGAVRDISDSLTRERAATNLLHATDSTALKAMATVVVGMTDSLHVQQAKPRRTWKSNAFIGVVGTGTGYVLREAVRAVRNRVKR